ncbi:hypothetical protein EB118_25000 [bacterium]|nr:hypothetical protein [bacterium]
MKSPQVKEGSMHSMTLTRAMASGILPTPRVKGHGNSHQRIEEGRMDDLTTLAKMGMLPTPCADDNPAQNTGKISQLNPLFVAEMMGFPTDWTILPFQSGETKA